MNHARPNTQGVLPNGRALHRHIDKYTARKSALEAIRHHCVHDCMGGDRRAVEECADAGCPLHPYRLGRRATTCPHRPTPAIRSFCLYRCMGGDAEAVAGCELSPDVDPRHSPCHLYSFRCGCNPNYAAATAGRA